MICSANARYHILIVDDNPDELKLLVELLRGENFRITLAFDGNQGYKRAVAVAPDLIIMDLRMPHTDGFTACRLLQHNPATAQIPIFFLSAARSMDERLSGLRNGGVDFVLKPFDPSEVLARIHIHLKRARPRAMPPAAAAASAADGPAAPAARPRLSAEQVIVHAATSYLAHCLAAPPHLPDLARKVGTYEKRLSQAFRKVLGKTVYEYLRDERLRMAQVLLDDTTLSITDIAAETGFSSPANFATAFRKKTGATPTEYRRRLAQRIDSADPMPPGPLHTRSRTETS
ncbi:DNA-binding response regulator [Bordetella genomosp. 7]|uniref:DNA-binding response regulator n=1 Tax=Bordetella genomosp. 7 TaxID=1416805 RepID=A0A261R056_9BORD|nr:MULTISPECIES: helix-turn-helix domain-containing protein [Bordetella]OZI18000.1 DNA-binding response regulator [Bordetella genomosp. 7]OZI21794.1 DNA-binding response regulator [Bordetella genomosp. 7]